MRRAPSISFIQEKPVMKMKLGQKLTLAAGLMFASVLVYEAPFEANAANSQSQVVFAPINEPPVIGNEPARIDFELPPKFRLPRGGYKLN